MILHLTDEDFADLLAGEEPNPAAEVHLLACTTCREELSSLTRAAADFNALSFAWAQAVAPRRIAPPTRLERLLARGGPIWALGLTTALIAGTMATHISKPYSLERKGDPVTATASRSVPAELAADNRLMQSINDELQSSSEPAVPVKELRVSARRSAQQQTAALAN